MIWIFPDIAYCLFLIHMHVSDLWQLAGLFLILLLHMSNKGWHFFRNPQTSNKLLQLQRKRAESCHQGEIIKSRGETAKRRKQSSHGLQPTFFFFFFFCPLKGLLQLPAKCYTANSSSTGGIRAALALWSSPKAGLCSQMQFFQLQTIIVEGWRRSPNGHMWAYHSLSKAPWLLRKERAFHRGDSQWLS